MGRLGSKLAGVCRGLSAQLASGLALWRRRDRELNAIVSGWVKAHEKKKKFSSGFAARIAGPYRRPRNPPQPAER